MAENKGDLISRSEVVKILENVEIGKFNRVNVIETIKSISTVEKPQGEWVENVFEENHCNRCGHPALWEEGPDDYYEVQSNFCPYCGADMRKGGAE